MKISSNIYSLLILILAFSSCKETKENIPSPAESIVNEKTLVAELPQEKKEVQKIQEVLKTKENFISIGDSKEKVIALLDVPESEQSDPASGRESLVFEKGAISLLNGKVNGWSNSSKNLPIHIFADNPSDRNNGFLKMGSTVWEATDIYGTPDAININDSKKSFLNYGTNKLIYEKGKLTAFQNDDGFFDIRFDIKNTGAKYISKGSSKLDVLSCQGTPTRITNLTKYSMWKYGKSYIMFSSSGVVTNWQNSDNNLKTQ